MRQQAFNTHILEGIAKILGDTGDGLTGTEIGHLLQVSKLKDVNPDITKWKRIFNSFVEFQNRNQCSNHVMLFIQNAMNPSRYIGKSTLFHDRRSALNKHLYLAGQELTENVKFRTVHKAETVDEAEERANRLKSKLEKRNTHPAIFEYCIAELLIDNYFHLVFEAVKSVAERLRNLTGVHADGNPLVDVVFSLKNPLIQVNLLQTDTDRSEHIGLSNLIKGIFGLIRNPTAHEPKIKFTVTEEDALDMLNTISFIHKRLDRKT